MSDKDLLVVISEMLRKQDQQAEKLEEHSGILNQHTGILEEHSRILNQHTEILEETKDTLKSFVDISVQQFQEQHSFNEQIAEFNKRFLAQFDRQNEFNERFLSKLDDISKKP